MGSSIIHKNIKGKQSDLNYSIAFPHREEARDCFKRAYKRLLYPPNWNELCRTLDASFNLCNKTGYELHRLAKVNDYFQINKTGSGTIKDDSCWVKIETIEDLSDPWDEEESYEIVVRTCNNPKIRYENVGHFFRDAPASSFSIRRKGNTVTSSYHKRDEIPNVTTKQNADNNESEIISPGAFSGLPDAQWSALVKSFLEK